MVIEPYSDSLAGVWDAYVRGCPQSTMLHTRRFLSYHADRFDDCSLLVYDLKDRMLAVFPAALSPRDSSVVISHPGATFGGLLGSGICRGKTMVDVLKALCDYYSSTGMKKLLYKAVPHIYHRMPVQDDLYALARIGAIRSRCDLSASIDLDHRGKIGSRRKKGIKKAQQGGVSIVTGAEYADQLWHVLTNNLQEKHGVKPVHEVGEILMLHERFPNEIKFVVAMYEGRVCAGVVLFISSQVVHVQYIGSDSAGYQLNALDSVFEYCIKDASVHGARYFDFGTSTEDSGRVLNDGLYTFKSEFGTGGIAYEFYEVDLENCHAA